MLSFVDKVCLCQRAHGSGAVTTGRLGQFGLRPPLLQQVACVYLVVCLLYFVAIGFTYKDVFGRHFQLGQCSPLLQQGLPSLAGQGCEGRDVEAEA